MSKELYPSIGPGFIRGSKGIKKRALAPTGLQLTWKNPIKMGDHSY